MHQCICRRSTLHCWAASRGALLTQCLSCRYMADEARSLKAYGELPDSSKCLHSLCTGCKIIVCEWLQGDTLCDTEVCPGVMLTDIFALWLQFASMRRTPSLTRTEPMTSTLTLKTFQVSNLAIDKSRCHSIMVSQGHSDTGGARQQASLLSGAVDCCYRCCSQWMRINPRAALLCRDLIGHV